MPAVLRVSGRLSADPVRRASRGRLWATAEISVEMPAEGGDDPRIWPVRINAFEKHATALLRFRHGEVIRVAGDLALHHMPDDERRERFILHLTEAPKPVRDAADE